jgi:hypothetical protein
MEDGRSAYNILAGKPIGKRPLGRPRLKWDTIIMDLKEIGINSRNLVDSAQDRGYTGRRALLNSVLNLRIS